MKRDNTIPPPKPKPKETKIKFNLYFENDDESPRLKTITHLDFYVYKEVAGPFPFKSMKSASIPEDHWFDEKFVGGLFLDYGCELMKWGLNKTPVSDTVKHVFKQKTIQTDDGVIFPRERLLKAVEVKA